MRQTVQRLVIGGAVTGALVFVSAAAPNGAVGEVLHVPRDYATIQTAVDAAQSGDTVLVAAGVYSEHVVVSTSGVRLQGGGADVVLDGTALGGLGAGIHVRGAAGALVTGVKVSNFEVRNYERGISLELVAEVLVSHNYVHNNVDKATPAVLGEGFGIELTSALSSDITHNTVSRNGFGGIRVGGQPGSTGNTVQHNLVADNGIAACQVCRNANGILLTGPASNNQVLYNEVLGTIGRGIALGRPATEAPITGILVAHNRVHGNQRAGVAITGSATDHTVEYNDARDNNLGNVGGDWQCNFFDNSIGRNGGNIFRHNHGTYGGPGDACAVPLVEASSLGAPAAR